MCNNLKHATKVFQFCFFSILNRVLLYPFFRCLNVYFNNMGMGKKRTRCRLTCTHDMYANDKLQLIILFARRHYFQSMEQRPIQYRSGRIYLKLKLLQQNNAALRDLEKSSVSSQFVNIITAMSFYLLVLTMFSPGRSSERSIIDQVIIARNRKE